MIAFATLIVLIIKRK
ncbi:hypothetical protein M7775_19810 [Sporomusa sphaeroides DSM 2875]|nr:hypothetical protein [Sporomusa sphaeroides]MCM0760799.1 hypothetical protein [Sporomusa sphaeroides DSM 2875]